MTPTQKKMLEARRAVFEGSSMDGRGLSSRRVRNSARQALEHQSEQLISEGFGEESVSRLTGLPAANVEAVSRRLQHRRNRPRKGR